MTRLRLAITAIFFVNGALFASWASRIPAIADHVGDPELEGVLLAHCKEQLASYKVPRRWFFAQDLPRTEAGKLAKRALREQFARG